VAPLAPAALQPQPHAPVLAQLERLHDDLAQPDLELPELLDIHDRAVVLGAYCREVNAAFDVWFDASVARLRSERRVGQLLEQIIASSPAWESHARQRRQYVPRGLLKQLGVSGSQSSRWRYIARLPDQDFEDQLQTARAAKRELTTTSLVRIARRLTDGPKHGGRPRLSTRTMLRRILSYAREIKRIQTPQERALLKDVLDITRGWERALGRPDVVQRAASCLLCGRDRPAFGATSRCQCGGKWVVS